jgi:hypothetical protein
MNSTTCTIDHLEQEYRKLIAEGVAGLGDADPQVGGRDQQPKHHKDHGGCVVGSGEVAREQPSQQSADGQKQEPNQQE